jgi:glycosyltransferase involved in cell wall biosynthesis
LLPIKNPDNSIIMNIAVNTQFLIKDRLEGLGWFTYETLKRITVQHPEHNFLFIFSKPFSEDFIFGPNVKAICAYNKYGHPLTWFFRFNYILPHLLKKHSLDMFLSPDGWSILKTDLKVVQVIHDLNFVHYPNWLPWANHTYYNHYFPRWARRANRIATVSEYSKKDIVEQYKIQESKVDVVFNGANEFLKPLSESEKTGTRLKYTGGNPYFIFVGASPPRKNLVNLFKAFDLFKDKEASSYKLVIAGAKKWWAEDIKQAYVGMKYIDDVIFTDRVSTEELNKLVSSAQAMTYVSLFEGFGIPLLEAMQCETAIITSNVTSMPEIAKDAALFVDPYSVESITKAMITISKDDNLRKQLIEKGRIRRNDFSWQKTANLLWNCIEKAANS